MAGRPGAWTLVEVDREAHTVLAPKAAVADLIGANRSWLSSANIVPTRDGLLDVREVARKFIEYREGVAHRRGQRSAADSDEVAELKAERLRLQNERLSIQNRASRNELLAVNELAIAWTRTLATFKSALEVIPRKLAAVEGVTREAEHELESLIDQALRDLASIDVGGAGGGNGAAGVAAGPEAPAGPDAQPMG